jgi:hypothetical protein
MIRHRLNRVFAVIALMGALALPLNGTVAQIDVVALPEAFLGTWTGTAEQVSPSQRSEYAVEIVLNGGEQFSTVGTIDYVGSNWSCAGALVLWLVVDEKRIAAGENITTGTEVCPTAGFVLITFNDDDTLSYEWRRPGMSDVVTATLTPAE